MYEVRDKSGAVLAAFHCFLDARDAEKKLPKAWRIVRVTDGVAMSVGPGPKKAPMHPPLGEN